MEKVASKLTVAFAAGAGAQRIQRDFPEFEASQEVG